jgi:hypothetical protein
MSVKSSNKGLIVGKTLVTVSMSHKVPIRILKATSQAIVIPKGNNLTEFSTLSSEYNCYPLKIWCQESKDEK